VIRAPFYPSGTRGGVLGIFGGQGACTCYKSCDFLKTCYNKNIGKRTSGLKRKIMKINRKKGFFSISAVAKIFSIHQQTIRLYEKQGLLTPKRSEGNTRLFSEEDIERLEEIISLTHQLGINLAGVELILKLKKQMKKMQQQMNDIFEATHTQLDRDTKEAEQQVKESAKQLLKIKQQQQITHAEQPQDPHIVDADNWEIEYEDD